MASGGFNIKNTLNLEPISTDPASPKEGDIQFSDGTTRSQGLWQYNGTDWIAIGSGGGGVNLIEGDTVNAESNIGDWAGNYADAAGTEPVDGKGAGATVAITRNTTNPLVGDGDFKFTKDAANRQGEGVGIRLDMDPGYRAKKLIFSFLYDTSDANYEDGDLGVYLVDIDNSNNVIRATSGEEILGGKGTHYATFQTSESGTDYRVLIHQRTTNAAAYDVFFDEFVLAPANLTYTTPTTDWIEYTPTTQGFGTPTINYAKYKRVGDTLFLQLDITAGTVAASEAQVGLPSSLEIDSEYSLNDIGKLNRNASDETHISVLATGGDNFVNFGKRNSGTAATFTAQNGNGLIGSSERFSINAKLKIQGWSSNVESAQELGGNREIVVEGAGNGGTSITANVTNIDFTETRDTTASWDGTTFTAPETGDYLITGQVQFSTGAGSTMSAYVDGSLGKGIVQNGTSNLYEFSFLQFLNKGQTLSIRNNTARTLSNSSSNHWIHISKLNSGKTLIDTETVAARYTMTTGVSTADNAPYLYDTLDFDTHNAYNTTTGIYTVPITGYYLLQGAIQATGNASQAIGIEVDGTLIADDIEARADLSNANVVTVLYLTKGQEVEFVNTLGAARIPTSDTTRNYMSIIRQK